MKDIARLFSQDVDKQLGHAVAVDLGGTRVVGFVMQQSAKLPGSFDDDEDRVSVYIAMSFQLGGFTAYVPRSSVTPLDVPPDQAIRAVLTGGSLQAIRQKRKSTESGRFSFLSYGLDFSPSNQTGVFRGTEVCPSA